MNKIRLDEKTYLKFVFLFYYFILNSIIYSIACENVEIYKKISACLVKRVLVKKLI